MGPRRSAPRSGRLQGRRGRAMGGARQRVGAGQGAGPLSDRAPNWGGEGHMGTGRGSGQEQVWGRGGRSGRG